MLAQERAQQGLGHVRIERRGEVGHGDVYYTERFGGLIQCYRRAAMSCRAPLGDDDDERNRERRICGGRAL